MNEPEQPALHLPSGLMAEVEAMAAIDHRLAHEMVHEAVESYLQRRRALANSQTSLPRDEVARRMIARRRLHPLPAGTSIRDLTSFGRA